MLNTLCNNDQIMRHPLLKLYTTSGIVIGLIALAFLGGLYLGEKKDTSGTGASDMETVLSLGQHRDVDIALFWDVWDLLDEKFVPTHGTSTEVLTDDAKLFNAIKGLTASYDDPYTVFFPPVESKSFEQDVSGNFEGVGMEIDIRDDVLTVVAPLKNTPADKAGVRSGDKIIEIDGNVTAALSTEEAVAMIRGEKGTSVTLTMRRENVEDPVVIVVVRDRIDIPAIETELTEDNIFVIRLYNFSAVSTSQFREALREFIKAKTDKLVLDLRGNPGGYLDAAIDMASWFLPSGKVIVKEDFNGDIDEVSYRSKGYNIFTDNLKFVILVDGGSASASEILAGALQEHGKATLIGMDTFGKGSVQELVSLEGGTSLKVTVARWLTPNGLSISEAGLHPDIKVEVTQEDINAGRDIQFDKAVEVLLQK